MKTISIFRGRMISLITSLLTLSLITPLLANKKQAAPQVELSATGKQLEAEYTKQMNTLKTQLAAHISKAGDKTKVLKSSALDAKLAKFVIIHEATPRGLAEFAQKSPGNANLVQKFLSSNTLMVTMLTADGATRPRLGRKFGNAQWGNAIKIYADIMKASSKAKDGLFNRLAIATSLAHATPLKQNNAKAETSAPEFINPVNRYLHFEKAYLDGELDPSFKNLSIWELRWVVNGDEPDKILAWGRETMRNYRPDHITTSNQGWRYVRIISSDVNYGSGDVKYDLPELQQYQNILMNGGICGRRAFFGRFILRAFGIPTIARPSKGHAALARFTPKGWTVCLGGGWGAGWTKTQYADDKDFLATTQARMNKDAFMQVKRAQWIGDVLGEKRVFGENDKTKPEAWNALALKTQRTIIKSLNATELKALGANIGEADGNSGVEKGMRAQVTEADKKITYSSNGTILIPAAALSNAGKKGVSTMKSFNGGLQIFLPRFTREGTTLLRGGSWKGDANANCSSWRLKSSGYGAYENWGFRVALDPQGTNNPKELTLEIAPGVKMDFVYIKPGSFTMGGDTKTDSKWFALDTPKHGVQITKGYYLGKYEVTQGQFQAIMGYNKSKSSKGPGFPADNISWDETLKFCDEVSFKTKRTVRLPTEAEWEYAARAGSSDKWFFGSNTAKLNDYAWNKANSGNKSHKVGQKKPNQWGLYDIYGNVVERVADVFDKNYYAKSPKKDPIGPTQGAKTVFQYEINAPASGTYNLTAKVVTNKHSQNMTVSVNDSDPESFTLPFTIGTWKDSSPVKVTLKKGKNIIRFSRIKPPQKGVAVKSFTLKPVK